MLHFIRNAEDFQCEGPNLVLKDEELDADSEASPIVVKTLLKSPEEEVPPSHNQKDKIP